MAYEDCAAARRFGPYDEVLVVGRMLEAYPERAGHAVSFHSDLFARWAAVRAARDLPPVSVYWGAKRRGRIVYAAALPPGPLRRVEQVGGSSGMMAVQVAVDELHCDRVVLAGMPMTSGGSHHPDTLGPTEAPGAPWAEADKYWRTWVDRADWLRQCVRSVSGRTRALLGAPTVEWAEGAEP